MPSSPAENTVNKNSADFWLLIRFGISNKSDPVTSFKCGHDDNLTILAKLPSFTLVILHTHSCGLT